MRVLLLYGGQYLHFVFDWIFYIHQIHKKGFITVRRRICAKTLESITKINLEWLRRWPQQIRLIFFLKHLLNFAVDIVKSTWFYFLAIVAKIYNERENLKIRALKNFSLSPLNLLRWKKSFLTYVVMTLCQRYEKKKK